MQTTEVGRTIRKARAEKGLSQRQLADDSGVDYKAINRIETGFTKRPYATTLAPLAQRLDLDLEKLLALLDEESVIGQSA